MTKGHCNGSYLAVARVAMELADADAEKLERIESDLIAGNDGDALRGMRDFFGLRKPPINDRENAKDYDRENQARARA